MQGSQEGLSVCMRSPGSVAAQLASACVAVTHVCRLDGSVPPAAGCRWACAPPAFFTLDSKHLLRTIRTVSACGSKAASYTSGRGWLNHFPREGGCQPCDIWRVAGSVWIHPRMIFISTCFSNFIRASVYIPNDMSTFATDKNDRWRRFVSDP